MDAKIYMRRDLSFQKRKPLHKRCKGISENVSGGYLRRTVGGLLSFLECNRFSAFPANNTCV